MTQYSSRTLAVISPQKGDHNIKFARTTAIHLAVAVEKSPFSVSFQTAFTLLGIVGTGRFRATN